MINKIELFLVLFSTSIKCKIYGKIFPKISALIMADIASKVKIKNGKIEKQLNIIGDWGDNWKIVIYSDRNKISYWNK